MKLNLFGSDDPNDTFYIRGSIDKVTDQLNVIPADLKNVLDQLKKDFDAMVGNLKNNIDKIDTEKDKDLEKQEIDKINALLKPLLLKIEGQQELQN